MIDVFHYKDLIETINEEHSFSKAAKKLYIPQPSLSVIVRKIEEEIGLPLFDRTSKPIRLTEAGREYLQCAGEIRQVERTFSNYVDAVSDLQTGTLRIGSSQLLSELVLPRFLSSFMKKYPKITIQIEDANSTSLESELNEGQLDMVIDNRVLDPKIFEYQSLKQEHILLAVPSSFPSNQQASGGMSYEDIIKGNYLGNRYAPADLSLFKNDPFILLTKQNETRQASDNLFKAAKFIPNIVLEVDRLTTMFRYVTIGVGASFVSDTLLQNLDTDPDTVIFYNIKELNTTRKIIVSYKRSRYYSKIMEIFIQELIAFF